MLKPPWSAPQPQRRPRKIRPVPTRITNLDPFDAYTVEQFWRNKGERVIRQEMEVRMERYLRLIGVKV